MIKRLFLCLLLLATFAAAQSNVYRIRMSGSGYSAQLRGIADTRTEGITINGSYVAGFGAHEFDVETSGRYELYYDSNGGTTYVKDESWGGPHGKFITGTKDIEDALDFYEGWDGTQPATHVIKLYDWQDPAVNQYLQMHVRWAHYLFDKVYTNADTSMHWSYDAAGVNYTKERRGVIAYAELLQVLHEHTEDTLYWNKLVDLAGKLYATADSVEHNTNAARHARTIDTNADTSTFKIFIHDDARMYQVWYYIYTQDPTNYAHYLTAIKDFIDVSYSFIGKNVPGWGWNYNWNIAATGTGDIVNPACAMLPIFARMKTDGITTTDITTTATYDTLLDSVFAFIDLAWLDDATTGGGGWEYSIGSGSINSSYNLVNIQQIMEAVEILQDTAYADSVMERLRGQALYYTKPNGSNYVKLRQYYNFATALGLKWAAKYDAPMSSDSVYQSYIANAIYTSPFTGNNIDQSTIAFSQRTSWINLVSYLASFVRWFNNDGFAEDWNHYRKHTSDAGLWSTNASAWYRGDGWLNYQDDLLGLWGMQGGQTGVVGMYHGDTTPLTPDPDTCSFNTTTKVLTRIVPTSGALSDGRTYVEKIKFGTPYMKVIPSTPAPVALWLDDTGDGNADSTFIFYYDMAGQLDTLKNTTLAIGDSVRIDPSKGVYAKIIRDADATGEQYALGFIANITSAWLKCTAETAATKQYTFSTTTYADSAMFFGMANYIATSGYTPWQPNVDHAEHVLSAVRKVWQNGFAWDGILKDKTQ